MNRITYTLRLPYNQAEQMYRSMVFNVITRNQDDHTKNTSFIMDKQGVWSLAPAYDLTWAYSPDGVWTSKHQMSICDKWDNFNREDLVKFAKSINVKNSEEIIERVKDAVNLWSKLATEDSLPKTTITKIKSAHLLDL